MSTNIIELLRQKALTSPCRHRVAAIGLSRKGDVVGTASNCYRYNHKGGGLHAERVLIQKYGKSIKQIVICRVGKSGEFRPIHPCENCRKIAAKYNIRILSIC